MGLSKKGKINLLSRSVERIVNTVCLFRCRLINNRELKNRRLLHDDAVGLRDMSTAHAFLGTYRRRAKVDDVGESDLPAS